MYSVKIKDIEKEEGKILKQHFAFEIKELSAKVDSSLTFKSLGDFIEVSGHVNGEIDVECDVCLTPYKEKLDFDIDETYAKTTLFGEYGNEVELRNGEFVTDLNGADEIDVYDLLYQSVILSLPNKKVCGINCNEGLFVTDEEYQPEDERLEIFKNIEIKDKQSK